MHPSGKNATRMHLLLRELRQRESTAQSVPYVSFILTHGALVLFFLTSFFLDHAVGSPQLATLIKIVLAVAVVLLLAGEWLYAIAISNRWKRDILLLQRLEEERRQREEQEKTRQQEELIAAEQLRNRVMRANLQRLRNQHPEGVQPFPVRSPWFTDAQIPPPPSNTGPYPPPSDPHASRSR